MQLSIGELARASGLTVKRLRHYHDTGVLEAAYTDPVTGYRWYDPDQVADALLVHELRAAGVGLEEVGEILRTPLRRHELVAEALGRTRDELEQAREQVARSAHLLGALPTVPMVVRRIPDQTVVSATAELSLDECSAWFDATYPRLYAAAGGPADGPCGACYSPAFFTEGRGPVVAYLPVPRTTPDATTLTGGLYAVALHDGSYDTFRSTYAALGAQVHRDHTPLPDADVREHYLIGPSETPEPHRWRSEVCWPLASPPA